MAKTVVFIDSRVNDLDLLVSQFEAGTEYKVLDASYDGLLQIEESLSGKFDYTSIQIISHGSPGAITIGSTLLTENNLFSYQSHLENIGYALTESGDLLLYGCNVGAGATGQYFVETLAQMTGADVAASDDLTGSAALGGDWILENTIGTIDALQVLADDSPENYSYTLMDISGQPTIYSSARDHLNQLIQIDFSKIPADDLSAIVPLQLSVLSQNNYFDKEISIYNLIFAIERMAQIEDELFLATTDTKALLNYMAVADNAYYKSMLSTESSIHSSIDNIMQNAEPGLLDYLGANFAQTWEGISGVSKAIFECVETSAGGIRDIFFSSGQSLTTILPSTFSYFASDIGLSILQIEKFTQFMCTAVQNTNGIFENFAALFSAPDLATKEAILADSAFQIAGIFDAYLQAEESMNGFTEWEGLQYILNFIEAIRSIDLLINDINAISTAAKATSLSGLSSDFLDDALWIKSLDGFDIAKDVVGLLLPLLNDPALEGLVTYWAEAVVTISDLIAISGKTEWNMLADQFSTYAQLVPVVTNYQSSISSWLKHADTLSGGTWGMNLAADLPSLPLPMTGVFSDRYDGSLENEPGASGSILGVGGTYGGTISSGDPGDWFVVSLVAGEDYRFQLTKGTISYADIKLYDAQGKLVANPDKSLCNSTTSVMQGTSLVSGTFYLVVDSDYLGSYTISFNTATPLASLTELGDAPGTTATPYRIAVGETFRGNMNFADNDSTKDDWIAVSLVAGQDYRFQLTKGTISYADIKLYDSLGKLVANPDKSLCSSTTSVIQGTALVSGTRYIAVDSGVSGSYTISFNTATPLASLTELGDAPGTTATPYRIAVGETFRGNMNFADNDSTNDDWIAVSLVAGQGYRFQLTNGTISYADIKLYDALGKLVANPDKSLCSSTTSVIQGTALVSGTSYIAVDSGVSGSYTISFNTATPLASLTELGDAPGTTATPYRIAVGETFRGNMNSADNDSTNDDWIAVSLVAGQDYRFQLTNGTISYADIKLYDALGKLVANPDKSLCSGTTSVIQGTALVSGTSYIAVDSGVSGSYTISFNTATPLASLTELGDAPGTTSTPYRIAVGETFRGNMNFADNDSTNDDWIAVSLVAGQNYRFQLTKVSIYSADIKLYDALGSLIANPTGSTSSTSFIEMTATASGTCFIAVDSGYSGSYTVSYVNKDAIAPTAITFSPADSATSVAVSSDIKMTFSEEIQKGSGNIEIHSGSAAGPVVERYDAATSVNLAFSGTRLTINPSSDLANGTHYFVTFEAGSIKDLAGNSYAGTDTYDFTTASALSVHDLAGSVTFWKTGVAIADVTSTLTSLPAATGTQPVEFRNIQIAADGTRTIEVWEISAQSDINSVELKLALPAGSVATWENSAALPYGWNLLGNTEKAGEFTLGGMGLTALSSGSVKLGTLTLTAPTNPQHFELVLTAGELGNDTVPAFGIASESMTTGSDGLYEHLDMPDGTYALISGKVSGTTESNAISAQDALAALKMAVGMNPNSDGSGVSPYQFLAADVNKDGLVKSADALNILKMAVGLPSAPANEWLFVPESVGSESMTRTHVEWPDNSLSVTLDMEDQELHLIGIVKGDVDGSWAA